VLPDTVHIEIVESDAIASITFAGDIYVIDSTGRVLDRSPAGGNAQSALHQSLIEIRGAEIEETPEGSSLRSVFGSELKLQYMQDILAALEREGLANDVSYIDVSNIVNVHFGFMGRYRVILGGSTNLRPSSIRHNLERLIDSVPIIEREYPNTSGDINLSDESGSPKFTPNN
jgi:hypothetical protein